MADGEDLGLRRAAGRGGWRRLISECSGCDGGGGEGTKSMEGTEAREGAGRVDGG